MARSWFIFECFHERLFLNAVESVVARRLRAAVSRGIGVDRETILVPAAIHESQCGFRLVGGRECRPEGFPRQLLQIFILW